MIRKAEARALATLCMVLNDAELYDRYRVEDEVLLEEEELEVVELKEKLEVMGLEEEELEVVALEEE
ncbi:hypothetical protein Pmani_005707 [Petrolisthes manimaculis]|uniref:Uncharacterized protein n=1 Tax=Petrolisthes manimaculis TaxID=1843537 RepID=A0AAE1QED9_9EUCA|nr:hypothetical protein Pmani_005707 [Petrolisthes manimaculis]